MEVELAPEVVAVVGACRIVEAELVEPILLLR